MIIKTIVTLILLIVIIRMIAIIVILIILIIVILIIVITIITIQLNIQIPVIVDFAVNNIITDDLSDCAFIGEVSLGGSLVFTGGIISMAIEAKNCCIKRLFLPAENAKEASVVEGLSVYGISHISDLINHFTGKKRISPEPPYVPSAEMFETED